LSKKRTAIALVDGEHYLPVIAEALGEIRNQGYDLLAAVFVGGTEKIADDSDLSILGVEVVKEKEALDSLKKALDTYKPEVVIDLSDEPVLDYNKRLQLASHTLKFGAKYIGADFEFSPPIFHDITEKPSISIMGTGKRVGKTAVSAYISRLLVQEGFDPCVIAMGRGGPTEPEVLKGDEIKIDSDFLLKESNKGKHAASDYYEDALVSRVTTVGCRRCGGGLAGAPFISNVLEGVNIANSLSNKFLILEGSGATLPPIKAQKNILIIGANQPIHYINGYFGTFRLLLADKVVVTLAEEPMVNKEKLEDLYQAIKQVRPDIPISLTVFRPKPLEDISEKKVFLALTARLGLEKIVSYLEKTYNCRVIFASKNLTNRALLKEEIKKNQEADILLTELKAAAVDVVTRLGYEMGIGVVYQDNIAVQVGGDGRLDEDLLSIAMQAIEEYDKKN